MCFGSLVYARNSLFKKSAQPVGWADFLCIVALMLCSIYAISMSRNPEEPVYNRIDEARTALGLSRQELADKVGVHYQTIGYLEREEYSPSLVLALKIAKVLNREVSDLFSQTPFTKGK
jgi:DNA-binding XRE family transcriptional regulator